VGIAHVRTEENHQACRIILNFFKVCFPYGRDIKRNEQYTLEPLELFQVIWVRLAT
jgi:hypothetical protein